MGKQMTTLSASHSPDWRAPARSNSTLHIYTIQYTPSKAAERQGIYSGTTTNHGDDIFLLLSNSDLAARLKGLLTGRSLAQS